MVPPASHIPVPRCPALPWHPGTRATLPTFPLRCVTCPLFVFLGCVWVSVACFYSQHSSPQMSPTVDTSWVSHNPFQV